MQIDILILPQGVLQSVLTSRIIFNIRDASRRSEGTELHTDSSMIFPSQVGAGQETENFVMEMQNMETSGAHEPV